MKDLGRKPNAMYAMQVVVERYFDELGRRAAFGTPTTRRLLHRLISEHDGGPVASSALLGIPITTTPALSRALQDMQREGLITREPSEEDGRVVLVTATAQGRDLMRGHRELAHEVIGATLAGISEDDAVVIVDLMRQTLELPGEAFPDY